MSTTPIRDITIKAGDRYVHTVPFWSDVAQTVPLDVSGRVFKAQVRIDATPIADVLETFDVDMTNAATGVVVLRLDAAQTTQLWALISTGGWDVQEIVVGETDPDTIFGGTVTIEGQYTQ